MAFVLKLLQKFIDLVLHVVSVLNLRERRTDQNTHLGTITHKNAMKKIKKIYYMKVHAMSQIIVFLDCEN